MALNDRQRAFLDEIKRQPRGKRNATEAAIKAGYSAKTARAIASRLLRNVYIKKEIDELDAERTQQAGRASEITCEWVIEKIKTIVDDPKTSHKDQLRGLELIGKFLDIWSGKQEQEAQRIEVVYDDPEMEAWGE